jgi:ribose/xylose/arabinose/galactoside ABC-type transport system permease subunit
MNSATTAGGIGAAVGKRLRDPGFWADRAAVFALFAVVVVFAILSPEFLTLGNMQAVLVAAAILVVLAVGQTYAVVTAGIDLSIGATPTLASVVVGYVVSLQGNIVLACILAVLTTTAFGILNGTVIAKGGITDFIVTLGALSVATGIALLISRGQPVEVINPLLLRLSTGYLGPINYLVLLALLVAIVAHVLMFHTSFGTHLLATGGDREAARNMGVNVDRIKISAYAISGFLAGIGGVMLTARVGSAEPTPTTELLLNSVAAVVLGGVNLFGGRGSIVGPVAGALLLTALLNGLTLLGVLEYWQPVVVGSVVIVSALLTRYQR